MAVIDESVVQIRPDFKGFRNELRSGLKKATAGITGTVKVRLVADATGFRRSAQAELKKVAPITYKVKLVADGSGISGGSRSPLAAVAKAEKAAAADIKQANKSATDDSRASANALGSVERQNRAARVAALRDWNAKHLEALRIDRQIDRDALRDQANTHATALRMNRDYDNQIRESRRQQIQADREAAKSRRDFNRQITPPKLINLGGAGIKPMNLLYASLVALGPVLVSVASSALQAGTSIMALGSAAYGGALAVTGLVTAFSGVLGALKLHQSLQKTQQGQAAKTAQAETSNAGAIRGAAESALNAKRSVVDAAERVRDAQREEKQSIADLAQAYKDASEKVRDLRLELANLRVQQSGNNLDAEEAARKLAEINANYFATDLQRRQAAQELLETQQKGRNIAADIVKTGSELRQRAGAGTGGSPEVTDARDAARRATQARVRAQQDLATAVRGSADAQRDYASALKGTSAATAGALAQDGQLQAALAELSPAARDLYNWALKNTEQFKRYRRSIEQAILPGFLSFLKDATSGGKSTADILVDGITAVGRAISRTTARMGAFVKSDFFKGALVRLNKDNEKAFQNVGDAAMAFMKPFTRLIVAASPLIVRFTGYIKGLATQFSDWITSFSDKDLSGWFKRAGDELATWWGIAKNLGSVLLSVFSASLPSGNNLVSTIKDLTGRLADWAKSEKGQTQLRKFFEFFANIDYGKIIRLAGSVATLVAAFMALKWSANNPWTALFGLFAAQYPDATVKFLEEITAATVKLLEFVDKHPVAVAQMLLLVGAYKTLKGIGTIKATLGGLPGTGGGGGLLGGGGKTATMTVHAGVVNILGGGGVGGGAAGEAGLLAGGAAAGGKGKGGRLRGLGGRLKGLGGKLGGVKGGIVATVGSIAAGMLVDPVMDKVLGKSDGKKGKKGAIRGGVHGAITGAGTGAMIGSVIPGIGTAIGGAAGGLIGGAVGAISGGGWWKPIQEFFTGLPAKVTGWLKTVWTAISTWFVNLGPNIATWASNAWASALEFFTSLPGRIVDALKELPSRLAYFGGQIVGWIIVGIVKGIPALFGMLKTLAGHFATGMGWIKDRVSAGISAALAFFAAMPGKIWNFLKGIPSLAWKAIKGTIGFFSRMIDGALAFFRTFPAKAVAFIKELPGQIQSAISAIPGFFSNMWTSIKQHFIDGINGAIHLLESFLSGVNSITEKFGVKIPHDIKDITMGSAPGPNTPVRRTGPDKNDKYLATGGPVPGFSPNSRADNIHARLTAGEWVQPVDSVKKYGPQFMKSVQDQTYEPGFALGGLVGSLAGMVTDKIQPPFIKDIAKGVFNMIPSAREIASFLTGGRSDAAAAPAAGGVVSGDPTVAKIAEATARAMGATEKQLIALIETGLVESGMQNLSGGDRDSVGFLQQRPSQGWGTPAQIMNVAYATRKFMEKAKRVDKQEYDAGQLAQAVQVSAYPDRYTKRYADAVAILNQAAPYVAGGGLGGEKGGRGWAWQESVLRSAFGNGVQFYSTTGGKHIAGSWHYKGRAVDLTPSMEIFNWIKSKYGATTQELIYGPAGTGIRHGGPHNYGAKLNAQHENHIHWAYGKGGLVKKFDGGGMLQPGVTMAVNNTGKPETVRTQEQEQALGFRRIDRRDLVLLASYITNAIAGQTISMDGRKVAETVRSYDYLPKGI